MSLFSSFTEVLFQYKKLQ